MAQVQEKSSSSSLNAIGPQLKRAAFVLAQTQTDVIDTVLSDLAASIRRHKEDILLANQKDIEQAKSKNQSAAFIDRLTLTEDRIDAIAKSVQDIRDLEDPVGDILEEWTRPNGLKIQKCAVPIGVLGIIYESRPNVTVDAAALCLKSHNAVLLRGGSDSLQTSLAFHSLITQSLENCNLPSACVSIIDSPERALVGEMLAAHDFIDVIIPRGGKSLTERVMREASMPVFAHLDGNCHLYVDHDIDLDQATAVILNAKLRRTGICGAAESLLLHEGLSDDSARHVLTSLLDQGCTVYGDTRSQSLDPRIEKASEEDWTTEYLDTKISCKYVEDVEKAIEHINTHGSHHTDAILTRNQNTANRFLKNVDSAIVLHNTSTQFADGGEFGMGAEIGIGTGKLHARGPVGLKQLTTFKYCVHGAGQTRP